MNEQSDDDSEHIVEEPIEYDINSKDLLKGVLMEAHFNLDPDLKSPAVIWARNKNNFGNLNKKNLDLLLNDITIISDDDSDSTIKGDDDEFDMDLYYGGCTGNRNDKTSFNARINILDLESINLQPEQRLTGNRHSVPSAYASRTLKSQSNLKNPQVGGVMERLLFAAIDINEKEKENYTNSNGKETKLKIFGSNTIPYLINSDCAKNIMVAVLAAYNNETPKTYIERNINSLRNNKELDPGKTILAWCFGHCIRAVIRYSKSNINKKIKLGSIWIKLDSEFKFYNDLDMIFDANEANDFIKDIDNELNDTGILENKTK
nr:2449_t:CDS:2 [Entrophospora candida]